VYLAEHSSQGRFDPPSSADVGHEGGLRDYLPHPSSILVALSGTEDILKIGNVASGADHGLIYLHSLTFIPVPLWATLEADSYVVPKPGRVNTNNLTGDASFLTASPAACGYPGGILFPPKFAFYEALAQAK